MLLTKKLTFNHLVKYLTTVTFGFLFDYAIYFFLVNNKISPYIANSISFTAGAIFTVILLRAFVFKKNQFSLFRDILLTFSTNGSIYLVGMAILFCCINILYLDLYLSKILTNSVTLIINYIIRLSFFSSH
jgi:putative flippase GtrA